MSAGTTNRFMADAGLGGISAVVSSLPIGYTLGEERVDSGIVYKLCYNAGNSQINPGFIATPITGATNPASVTVSSVSLSFDEYGAVVVNNVTATTGTYFWGARRGYIASGLVGETKSVTSGSGFYIAGDGTIQLMPQSVVTGLSPAGISVVTILSTTSGGGRNGSAYISFP